MPPRFFKSSRDWHRWLTRHHDRDTELWLGIYKKTAGKSGITYAQALDEALCFGWIDGVRKRHDDASYTIRFTPRKPRSKWSAVNVRHVKRLMAEGRMQPPGLDAFERRDGNRAGYSFEERPKQLPLPYAKRFRSNQPAWKHFRSRPPGYRRTAIFWVVSAKKEETRQRRLETLIAYSEKGKPIPPLART